MKGYYDFVKRAILIGLAFLILYKMGQFDIMNSNLLLFTILFFIAYVLVTLAVKVKE